VPRRSCRCKANDGTSCKSNDVKRQRGCDYRPCLVEKNAHKIDNMQCNHNHVEVSSAIGAVVAHFDKLKSWPDGKGAISKDDLDRVVAFISKIPTAGPPTFPVNWGVELRRKFNQLRLIRGSALNEAKGEKKASGVFRLYKGLPGCRDIVYDLSEEAIAPPDALFCRVRGLLLLFRSKEAPETQLSDAILFGDRYTLHLLGVVELTILKEKKNNKRKGGDGDGPDEKGSKKAPRRGGGRGPGDAGSQQGTQMRRHVPTIAFVP
jgi:hypothetical protein